MKTRAAILMGKGHVIVEEIELRDLKEDELLIRIQACNLCTSEYGIYTGNRSAKFPYRFGHEWTGTVVETGSGVKEFQKGDFVGGIFEYETGSVQAQLGYSSRAPRLYAFHEMNEDGYYGRFRGCAEYLIQKSGCAFHMNPDMDPSEAAFLEPTATVISGIRKLHLTPADKVLVIGAGTMGILNAQIAKSYGCTVVESEMIEKKLKVAESCGIDTVDVSNGDAVEQIQNRYGSEGFDVVIVAVGSTQANRQAARLLKEHGGTILLFAAGYPAPEVGIDANEIHYRNMCLQGTYTANYRDFYEAAQLLGSGRMNVAPLVEAKYPLEQIDAAFRHASSPGAYRVSIIFP